MVTIDLLNVHKSFGGHQVLRGVDLSIKEGETLVVIGRSGCGKSVMLKHLVGLIRADRGQIFVDGEDITRMRERGLFRIRRKFGFLFQSAALLDSLTVGENVGLGLTELSEIPPARIAEIVAEKLALVGMAGTEAYMPADLSGGMKKRVGLARAIAMEPEIVLYDEPTTGLDPIMADSINELILHLKHELKITSIVVTHDMASARKVADRVAMMYEGRIIFTGTVAEMDSTESPIIRQFIEGRADGPIQAGFKRPFETDTGNGPEE